MCNQELGKRAKETGCGEQRPGFDPGRAPDPWLALSE